MLVPWCQTEYWGLTARQVTLCYPGNGHAPRLPLTEADEESARLALFEDILSISLLNKALDGTEREGD